MEYRPHLKRLKIVTNVDYYDGNIVISTNKFRLSYYDIRETYNDILTMQPMRHCNKELITSALNATVHKTNLSEILHNQYGEITEMKNFLSPDELKNIKAEIQNIDLVPVPKNGKIVPTQRPSRGETKAERGYIFSKETAYKISLKLKSVIENTLITSKENYSIDCLGHKKFNFVGVNPLLRVIKYDSSYKGSLIPHYDYPFDESNKRRTLKTMLIYLTTSDTGATRFLKDDIQEYRKFGKLHLKDYSDLDDERECIYRVKPEAGNAIIFDHRLLHDSEPISDGEKIVLFIDLIYEEV